MSPPAPASGLEGILPLGDRSSPPLVCPASLAPRSLARSLGFSGLGEFGRPRVRAPTTHPHTARPAAPPPAGRPPCQPAARATHPHARSPAAAPLAPPPLSPPPPRRPPSLPTLALSRGAPRAPPLLATPFCCFHRSLFLLVVVGASGVQVRQNLAWPAHAATSPRVTASHPNSEVKLGRVEVVLSSGRGWEGSMLYVLPFLPHGTE